MIDTDLEEYIKRKMASGQFQSRDEVIEAALDVYQDIDETDDLRDEIQRRLKDAEAGNIVPFDFEDLRHELRTELARRRAGQQ